MPGVKHKEGQELITSSVDRLCGGTRWEEVEGDLEAALRDGRIDSATADWAHRRTRVVARQDRRRWRCWAKVVACIHEDRRAGSWKDRFQGRLGRRTRLGAALLELAQAEIDSGYPEEGSKVLRRTWPVVVKHGNVGQQGTCRYLQARCEASAGHWAECAEHAKNAARLLTDARMYLHSGRAHVLAAEAAVNRGDDAGARRAAQDAEGLALNADEYGRAALFKALMDHFRTKGDLSQARRLAEPALDAARASGRGAAVAAVQEAIGILTATDGDPAGGLSGLIQAAEQYRAAGLTDQAIGAQLSAAQVALTAEDLDQAHEFLDRVARDPDTTRSPVLHARLLIMRGRLAHTRGDEATAGKLIEEGVAILKAAGFSPAAAGITIVDPSDADHG